MLDDVRQKDKADAQRRVDEAFLQKDAYFDPAFARLEAERLWPRVWQVACRLEEIPRVGDFVTYEIVDDSILVVRTADDTIKAYHNVCQHRGRRLMDQAGHTRIFVCRFHGWRWNLDGENTLVSDRKDWDGCLADDDIKLRQVRVATWGGWVFINMDPKAQPFADYLAPVDERCGKFEFEKMRYRWYKTFVFPCNWKIAVEAFNEAYHVQGTHGQFLKWLDDYTVSETFGIHSAFFFPPMMEGQTRFSPSQRTGVKPDKDLRPYVLAYYKEMHEQLHAMVTPRAYEAVQRLMAECPADATGGEIMLKVRQLVREAAEADGAGWPDLTPEYFAKSMNDWHVFPNFVFLHSNVDGMIAYRARPNGNNPESCIFDVWSLMRYAPGKEPPLKREFYEDYRTCDTGRVLQQDFANMADVQKGIKSRGFPGARTNPVQEKPVANFHRVIRQYLSHS